MSAHELTIPISNKQADKHIVVGPVLVPGEPDSDGDIVTAEKIEEVAVHFMLEYGNVDVMHSLNNVGKVVFSDVLRQPEVHEIEGEEVELPAGTWIMGVKVTDENTWSEVQKGNFKGFSIMAIPPAIFKSLKSEDAVAQKFTEAQKRTTLEQLGEQWIVNAVSVVDDPAVPKAKFFAIKRRNQAQYKIRSSARTPSFDGTENTSWGDVDKSFSAFIDGWIKHTGANPDEKPSRVEDAPASAKRWIASRTLLGEAGAENVRDLIFFPVVNPNTDNLNRGALQAVISGRGSQADIPQNALDSARTRAQALLQSEFNEEKSMNKKNTQKGRWIPGEFMFIVNRLRDALGERFDGEVDIEHVFSDRVIFRMFSEFDPEASKKMWLMNYVYNDSTQEVELQGEPQEVEVQGMVVPKRTASEWDTLISKFTDRLENESREELNVLPSTLKSRLSEIPHGNNPDELFKAVYSEKSLKEDGQLTPSEIEGFAAWLYKSTTDNYPALKQSWFDKLKGLFNKEKEDKSIKGSMTQNQNILEDLDMNKEELKQLIQSTVKESLGDNVVDKETLKTEVQESIKSFLQTDEFKNSVKAVTEGSGEGADPNGEGEQPENSEKKAGEDKDPEKETPNEPKSAIEKRLEELQAKVDKMYKGSSTAEKGQDGVDGEDEDKTDVYKSMTGRDIYGRRKKSYEELEKEAANQ